MARSRRDCSGIVIKIGVEYLFLNCPGNENGGAFNLAPPLCYTSPNVRRISDSNFR
jgi:hypothetical protein